MPPLPSSSERRAGATAAIWSNPRWPAFDNTEELVARPRAVRCRPRAVAPRDDEFGELRCEKLLQPPDAALRLHQLDRAEPLLEITGAEATGAAGRTAGIAGGNFPGSVEIQIDENEQRVGGAAIGVLERETRGGQLQ